MDSKNVEANVSYDYRSLGEDIELLQEDEMKFCLKQCYKMGYYAQRLHNKEILRMRCEFLKDENGTIWFSFADKIVVRPLKTHKEATFQVKRVKYINKKHQEQLKEQLNAHR